MTASACRPLFRAPRPGYKKTAISIKFKYHSTQKASYRIKRVLIHIFSSDVLELIATGIFYGFLNIYTILIECVHTYKLLGVYVTDNLCWSTHCEYIVLRARKRLYALRCLKKSGVIERDLVLVYSSLIRSVLEYASPVWANLPEYLRLLIEGVQKKALEIIFPGLPYKDALVHCGLRTLSDRRFSACTKFIQRVRDTGVLANLLPERTTVSHGYNLRSGTFR